MPWSGKPLFFRSCQGDRRLVASPAGRRTGPGIALRRALMRASEEFGFDLKTPFNQFPRRIQNLILYGKASGGSRSPYSFPGIIPILDRWYGESTSESYREWFEQYMSAIPCPQCGGKRLRPES